MRKLIFIPLLVFCLIACKKSKKNPTTPVEINVENVTSSDKEYMTSNYDSIYKWFESCIVLENFLDEDSCDGKVASVTNVFQVIKEKEKGYDVFVVLATHTPDDTASIEVKQGFWVEDFPLDSIKVTFKEAFDKVMATNSPKPHSKQCVLRKEVGPIAANPQYIFGNIRGQLYVDAITGEVSDKDPSFPEKFTILY